MIALVTRKLEARDEAAFKAYRVAWLTDQNPFAKATIERYADPELNDFSDYLARLRAEESQASKADYSTATAYFGFLGQEIVGHVNCRWQLEKGNLLEWGGHIGYGIAPHFRGRGLAQCLTKFALEKYREHGIRSVMISANVHNLASRKTIEACGGRLENQVEVEGETHCRYWISL